MTKTGLYERVDEESLVKIDIQEVVSGFYQFANFTRSAIQRYLSKQCYELENYMKSNHLWKNRTGNAEAGLYADYYEEGISGNEYIPVTLGITLGHGVFYGEFLEMAMEQNYAILEPTVMLKGPDVVRGMQGLIDRLAT